METIKPKNKDYRIGVDTLLDEQIKCDRSIDEIKKFVNFCLENSSIIEENNNCSKEDVEQGLSGAGEHTQRCYGEIQKLFKLSYAFASLLITDALEFVDEFHSGCATMPDEEKSKYLERSHPFMCMLSTYLTRQFASNQEIHSRVMKIIEDAKLTPASKLIEYETVASDWFLNLAEKMHTQDKNFFFGNEINMFQNHMMNVIHQKIGSDSMQQILEKFKAQEQGN